MNQLLYNPNVKKSEEKTKIWIIVIIAIICVIGCLSTVFALANRNNEKILENVYIDGIDVGKKTKEEAFTEVQEKIKEYQNTKIILSIGEKDYPVTAEDIGFDVTKPEDLVESAYAYGRDKNFFINNYTILYSHFKNKEIDVDYAVNEQKVNELVANISAVSESLVLDDSYRISGDKLFITKGQDGLKIDKEKLKEYLLSAVKNHVSIVEVPIIESESKKLDLSQVYTSIYVAPQDASYTSGDKFELIPEKTGLDFDLEEAKAKYQETTSGEIEIALRELLPSVRTTDIEAKLFENTISSSTITYTVTASLRELVQKIDGTIVNPKEEFSFKNTLKDSKGSEESSVLATAIYHSVLKANLEVTERIAHERKVAYAEPSLDVLVNSNNTDFKFKNTNVYPIKINAEVKGNSIIITLLGNGGEKNQVITLESVVVSEIGYTTKKENDASMYVGTTKVSQKGINGCISEAYKVVKDTSDKEVSRDLISKDTYQAVEEIVKVGTKVINTTPVTPIVEEPKEEKPERELPPGWDSPESPYSR